MIFIYTKDNCAPCAGTKKFLNDNGVEFTEYNVSQDPALLDAVIDAGYSSVPLVVTPEKVWAGLNIQNLRELV